MSEIPTYTVPIGNVQRVVVMFYDHEATLAAAKAETEELKAYIQTMVNIAADNRLDGYRELGEKCALLEEQKDKLRADLKLNASMLAKQCDLARQAENERDAIQEAFNTEWEEAEKLKVEIEELRAEVKRLADRDGKASISLIVPTAEDPFGRIPLKICDFGVADNCYVTESPEIEKLKAELDEAVKAFLKAIEDEPECPGTMPDELWAAMKEDRDTATEALRITVRLTKENIKKRLQALSAKEVEGE